MKNTLNHWWAIQLIDGDIVAIFPDQGSALEYIGNPADWTYTPSVVYVNIEVKEIIRNRDERNWQNLQKQLATLKRTLENWTGREHD